MFDWNMARANKERYLDMIRDAEQRRSLKAAKAATKAATNDCQHRATRASNRPVPWLTAVLIALKLSC